MNSPHDELGLRGREGAHQVFRDQSLLITDANGEVNGAIHGAYYANTRILSRLKLCVNGEALFPVQAHPARNDLLVAYFQDPCVVGDARLQDHALVVQLSVTVGAGFHIDLDARNHSLIAIDCTLSLLLEADFADAEETRVGWDASKILPEQRAAGHAREQDAAVRRTVSPGGDELRFEYLHPQLDEAVVLRFTEPPQADPAGATWRLALEPQAAWHTCIDIVPVHQGKTVEPVARCYGEITDDAKKPPAWVPLATQIETANDTVRRGFARAVDDLASLAMRQGPAGEQAAFAAGIPLYHNIFGRDLLTTGWQAALATPRLLESAILVCENYQGRVYDDFRDEQPGRIIQQVRSGPLNLLNLNPRGRYYSDYASPGDFVIMLGQHFMWTGDRDFLRTHLPAAERVLAWLERDADLDGDGFYEYQTRSPQGDRNQGWKDSEHAILHTDGEDAVLPIATCEVQGYIYAGMQQLGAALIAIGHVRRGVQLLNQARRLQDRFMKAFWMPEEGFLAMALDGQKRQVRSIGSNAAHCLAAGIVTREHAEQIANRLLAPDMFSGWGVRTLSADHVAYNPFGYHLGSVWTVEQATIAFGLKRYGFGEQANAVAKGTFDLVELHALHRLPEAVGGVQRDRQHPFPGIYPQACWPQAWSAGAVILMLQTMLGLRPIAPLGILFVYPELPDWLPEITLRGLRVGGSTLSIQFKRQRDGSTDYRVIEREGHVRVLRESPDQSTRHGLLSKIGEPLLGALTNGF